MTIHPTAIVETDALGSDVVIGPYAVISAGAMIGNRAVIHPHVVIASGVEIGDDVEIFPGSFLGKEPKGTVTHKPRFQKHVTIGKGCCIGPHATIYYDVEIGNLTLVGDNASIRERCRVGESCIISRGVTLNYNVIIGDRTKIMDSTHITGTSRIGNDVFVSPCVKTSNDKNIANTRHSPTDTLIGPTIHDKATVGVGAILLPGVTIGKGAMVGAGSVVTADVSPATLVYGVPARPQRKLKIET